MAEIPTSPPLPPPPQYTRYTIPWPLFALLSAAMVLWALARIVPDVLAHTHGRSAEATVTRMAKKKSVVWLDFEAHTADAGTIRGKDMLITRWPPATGDRVKILYLAAGDWRHAIVAQRDWLNALLMRWIALFLGFLLGAAALVARADRRAATRSADTNQGPDGVAAARALHSFT